MSNKRTPKVDRGYRRPSQKTTFASVLAELEDEAFDWTEQGYTIGGGEIAIAALMAQALAEELSERRARSRSRR